MNRLAHSVLKEVGFTLLAEGKTLKVRAEGYSMYPSIKPGSVIYIEPFETGNEPVPGEIIAWKKESGFVVHRLVMVLKEEEKSSFVTRGDSCIYEDDPITFEQLAGRVVTVETPDGKPVPAINYLKPDPNYSVNRLLVRMKLYLEKAKRIFSFSF
jgi:signal peptidase I